MNNLQNELTLEKATINDANELLLLQRSAFRPYTLKYADFTDNPAEMTLDRMRFNIGYQYGHYCKIIINNKVCGGVFSFQTDEPNSYKIAQFYLDPFYQHRGYGTIALFKYMALFPKVKCWKLDTIMEETDLVKLYQNLGFVVTDVETIRPGFSFAYMEKRQ